MENAFCASRIFTPVSRLTRSSIARFFRSNARSTTKQGVFISGKGRVRFLFIACSLIPAVSLRKSKGPERRKRQIRLRSFKSFQPFLYLSYFRKTSVQGRPYCVSFSMNGAGSNSSILKTPLPFHVPVATIIAPIIAGTPVV